MTGTGGPRWLDGLARRAARGEVAERPGLSRRTVLQTAGAAVLLAGPLRLVQPGVARAQGTDCEVVLKEKAFTDYKPCVLPPLADQAKFKQAAQLVTDALPKAKTAKKRKALRAILAKAKAGINTTTHKIEACNAKYVKDRLQAEVTCEQAGGGGGGGGGGGPPPSSPCAPGTTQCNFSSPVVCCYGGDSCCQCGSSTLCCIYSDCRCCPLDTPWG